MIKAIFHKTKISFNSKVAEVLLNELDLTLGRSEMDLVNEELTLRVDAFIMSRLQEEKTIVVHRPPQSFIGWLFRKQQSFEFKFDCREVLIKPPVLEAGKSTLTYEVKEV